MPDRQRWEWAREGSPLWPLLGPVDHSVKVLLDLSRVSSEPSESKATCTHGLCYNGLISYM
jgi:hypothetical protein